MFFLNLRTLGMEGNGSGVGTSNYQSLILTLLLPVCYEASIQTLSISLSASGQVGDGAGWGRVGWGEEVASASACFSKIICR